MRRTPEKAFAHNIRTLREMRGWTQEQISEMIGVTQKQISKYESGKDWVSASGLVAYGRIFGVTPDQLLGLKPVLAHSAANEALNHTP